MPTGSYSIRELEVLSGIKAHTIRIWEARYNVLEPVRSEGNVRLYSDADVINLLNIALLNKNGYRISHIASMSREEVHLLVRKLADTDFETTVQIDALVVPCLNFDEESFEKIINTNILRSGFVHTFIHLIFPFLSRVGTLWQTSVIRPAQEHFISNLIRQKIIVAIDGQIVNATNTGTKSLLFLPDKEQHELSILFTNYMLRNEGNHTLYLGASVPMADVELASRIYKPDYVISAFISQPTPASIDDYVKTLSSKVGEAKVLLSGRQTTLINPKHLPHNVSILPAMEDIMNLV